MRDNILYGRPTRDAEMIAAACAPRRTSSSASSATRHGRRGFDAVSASAASSFSGGQRQRIAIVAE